MMAPSLDLVDPRLVCSACNGSGERGVGRYSHTCESCRGAGLRPCDICLLDVATTCLASARLVVCAACYEQDHTQRHDTVPAPPMTSRELVGGGK